VAHAGHGVEAHVLVDRRLADRGDELLVVVDGRVVADHLVGQPVQHDEPAAAAKKGARFGLVASVRFDTSATRAA
jgi:hypothetical protein